MSFWDMMNQLNQQPQGGPPAAPGQAPPAAPQQPVAPPVPPVPPAPAAPAQEANPLLAPAGTPRDTWFTTTVPAIRQCVGSKEEPAASGFVFQSLVDPSRSLNPLGLESPRHAQLFRDKLTDFFASPEHQESREHHRDLFLQAGPGQVPAQLGGNRLATSAAFGFLLDLAYMTWHAVSKYADDFPRRWKEVRTQLMGASSASSWGVFFDQVAGSRGAGGTTSGASRRPQDRAQDARGPAHGRSSRQPGAGSDANRPRERQAGAKGVSKRDPKRPRDVVEKELSFNGMTMTFRAPFDFKDEVVLGLNKKLETRVCGTCRHPGHHDRNCPQQ